MGPYDKLSDNDPRMIEHDAREEIERLKQKLAALEMVGSKKKIMEKPQPPPIRVIKESGGVSYKKLEIPDLPDPLKEPMAAKVELIALINRVIRLESDLQGALQRIKSLEETLYK